MAYVAGPYSSGRNTANGQGIPSMVLCLLLGAIVICMSKLCCAALELQLQLLA